MNWYDIHSGCNIAWTRYFRSKSIVFSRHFTQKHTLGPGKMLLLIKYCNQTMLHHVYRAYIRIRYSIRAVSENCIYAMCRISFRMYALYNKNIYWFTNGSKVQKHNQKKINKNLIKIHKSMTRCLYENSN